MKPVGNCNIDIDAGSFASRIIAFLIENQFNKILDQQVSKKV